jgi:hypothetical protein
LFANECYLRFFALVFPLKICNNVSMSSITFDRLTYIETLKSAGITDEQARAHTHALDDALRDTVVTKSDLRESEMRTTIRLGSMIVAATAFLAAIQFFR